ncbi:uncharacterized protein LOC123430265 isoform X2 [Hordeum vulgare subsp. vulgare]|uniref:uncharacterized protein LOC123430265 isoform X2 n=1 Tax=Hordeum vulgare subsp. vulgare TaxID=112509 RepID=UPI001D1A4A2E|nr:uncharacterized protein LOC123430265 isoform X2 [Hordeum vulgare subsp. vulgare]
MAEAEECERQKTGRRRRRRGRRKGDGSDPVEVLGEEVIGLVMELLDARSVARCTAVSRAWYEVAADNRLWAPKCAELMAGKAHIPRLTMIRTASKLSTYSMAIMDGKRAAPEYWRNLDPSWKHTGPPMRRYFHHDGYHSADPHDAVWGGHECEYTIITSFVGDGRIRDHYVRINRWPPMKVSRKEDWSWELSNHLYRYNSIPDAEKEGCTGPLFPVW